ncbi:hypothetical protein HPB50_008084 [Hyalomma asiaticum]|uniref:Uncharacterized protein n=1 Tax=Hyalomma asiaticum TaxID=266040 RepID=A0ACB7RSH1_HYAAI|nr:hypothetical protein HPB50_008084 [Hyalomma asiaticum]
MAQRLPGDIQLLVGDQQLPFRGHAKVSGEIFQGVITINPDETPQRIKSEFEWSQGTILAVRKLGNSTAAVVTFQVTKVPLFIFYHSVVAYVRPYKKTIPRLFSLRHHWAPTLGLPANHSRSLYPLWHSSPSDSARPSST